MNNRFLTLLPPSVQVFHRALPKNLRYGFSACLDNDNRLKKKQGRTDTSSRPKKAISTSGKRDSNSRPRPWQGRALPTELFPHDNVPRTGLEPACLATHAPETCASTIPPPGLLSGKRDSNSRPRPWQGRALPTELFPQSNIQPNPIINSLNLSIAEAKVMLFF